MRHCALLRTCDLQLYATEFTQVGLRGIEKLGTDTPALRRSGNYKCSYAAKPSRAMEHLKAVNCHQANKASVFFGNENCIVGIRMQSSKSLGQCASRRWVTQLCQERSDKCDIKRSKAADSHACRLWTGQFVRRLMLTLGLTHCRR